jgi:nickel/cobalt exporter
MWNHLSGLLRQPELSLLSLAIGIAIAFVLGAAHAVEPGHGKTIVAAYLVGSRGTLKHAFLLGGIVTFTHTISVFALGVATLFLTQSFDVKTLFPALGIISGLGIVAVGLWILPSRWHMARHHHGDDHGHHHHHGHGHDHHHHHHHDHDHVHSGGLIALGASGGLVPCPSALVLLLTAISVGHVGAGLVLLVSFSLGLAVVLIAIGAAVLYAKRFVPERHAHGSFARWAPVVSAVVIVVVGIVMTVAWLPR